jgi:hypothetical protein
MLHGQEQGTSMSPDDYRRLCRNAGRILPEGRREARTVGRRRVAQCDGCGRLIDVFPDPGSGSSLLYAMHFKDAGRRAASPSRGSA